MSVEVNMSRDGLASLGGAARENVVCMLSEFKQEGSVETKGRKIIVLDAKKLTRIANYR
jgi:CRP-like cAMP-binding protein